MISDTPISDSTPHNVAELGMLCRKLERQLNEANEKIRMLEHDQREFEAWLRNESVDNVLWLIRNCEYLDNVLGLIKNWRKAKEAKL